MKACDFMMEEDDRRAREDADEVLYLAVERVAYRGAVPSVRLTVPGHYVKDETLKVNIHLSLAPHHDSPLSALTWGRNRGKRYTSLMDGSGSLWLRGKSGEEFVDECREQYKRGRVLMARLVIAKGQGEDVAEFYLDQDVDKAAPLGSWEGRWVK